MDLSLFLGEKHATSIWATSHNVFKEMKYLINDTSDDVLSESDDESIDTSRKKLKRLRKRDRFDSHKNKKKKKER